jgi:pimeloyl-ACP methyl ester carboxylesterase
MASRTPSFQLRSVDCLAVAFPNVVGPFGVTGAGHFLQWEQAALFNRTLQWFCRDLLVSR